MTILSAILHHNLNYAFTNQWIFQGSKTPSSTWWHPIEPLIKSHPIVPNSTTWALTAKNINFLLISVSSKGSTLRAASQLLDSIRMPLFWSSGHTPICCKYALPPFPCVKCLQVQTPDMCIRRALFTLINGPRLWQGVNCSRPDSSDK